MLKTFFKRTFSTIILVGLFFCAIFLKNAYGTYVFGILAILLSYMASFECGSILKKSGHPCIPNLTSFFVTLTAICCLIGKYQHALTVAVFVCVLGWIMILCAKGKKENLEKVFYSLGIYVLFAIPICFMIQIYRYQPLIHTGNMYLLYLILVTKIADIGAYVTGTVCNALSHGKNHKLIPSISPGKSWEGMIGGFLITLAASWFLWHFCGFPESVVMSLIAGAVLFFGSMAGDLSESSFKRICEVKDSGHVLPGIGGIFDLVDSLMINTILFWFFLTFFLGVCLH